MIISDKPTNEEPAWSKTHAACWGIPDTDVWAFMLRLAAVRWKMSQLSCWKPTSANSADSPTVTAYFGCLSLPA